MLLYRLDFTERSYLICCRRDGRGGVDCVGEVRILTVSLESPSHSASCSPILALARLSFSHRLPRPSQLDTPPPMAFGTVKLNDGNEVRRPRHYCTPGWTWP